MQQVKIDNGPLYVVPGSHRRGYMKHVDTPSHLGLPESEGFSFETAVPIDGDAGDAIFFHLHTVHGSPPNRTNQPRATFINRYLAADDFMLLQAATVKARNEAEAKAKADEKAVKLAKTRGFILRGRRPFDPDFNYDIHSGVHH